MGGADQIGDHADAQRQVARQQPGVEHRVIPRGPGVQRSADILDILGDRAGVARACALEHHMLDHMGQPAEASRLRSRADIGIEAHRQRLHPVHRLDRDGQPVRQSVEVGAHAASASVARSAICASTASRVAGSVT